MSQPLSTRTPPLHCHRSNETPAPHWLRRNETKSDRRHKVEPNHSEYVWQPRQPKGVKCGELAERAPTGKTAASAVFPTSPTKYEGMDPARHLHQSKLH